VYCLNTTGGPLTRFAFEGNGYLDAVGDSDEGNAAGSSRNALRSKAIFPFNLADQSPWPDTTSVSFSGLVTPRIVKVAVYLKGVAAGLYDPRDLNGSTDSGRRRRSLGLERPIPSIRFRYPRWQPESLRQKPLLSRWRRKFRVASHFSKVPCIATTLFRLNADRAFCLRIAKTGAPGMPFAVGIE